MPECLSEKIVITRKKHVCQGCTKVYPEKSRMIKSVNVDEGDIYSLYFCENCIEFIKNNPEYFKDLIYYGDLLNEEEYVKKYIQE